MHLLFVHLSKWSAFLVSSTLTTIGTLLKESINVLVANLVSFKPSLSPLVRGRTRQNQQLVISKAMAVASWCIPKPQFTFGAFAKSTLLIYSHFVPLAATTFTAVVPMNMLLGIRQISLNMSHSHGISGFATGTTMLRRRDWHDGLVLLTKLDKPYASTS